MENKNIGSRNFSIDLFRVVFSILVVALHSSPFVEYNSYVSYFLSHTFSRLAVPFFAAVSGYYFFSKSKKNYWKSIKNLLYLYVPWSLISYTYTICYWKGTKIECLIHLIKSFFFYGWQQLWYMLAMIYLLLFLFIMERIGVKFKYLFFISIPFLILGIIHYAYGAFFRQFNFFERIFFFTDKIEQKNWLLLVFPFFMIGWLVNQIKDKKIAKYSTVLSVISLLGFSFEIVITNLFNLKSELTLCFFTYFVILFLMLFCIYHPGNVDSKICNIFSKTASCIYVVHQVVLSFCGKFGISETPSFFIALIIPLIITFIVLKSNNKTLNKII